MVKLWRCEICGESYIGEKPPENCPFCGAHKIHIKEAKKAKAVFDVLLNESDRKNVEKALQFEVSNANFYKCAESKTNDKEGKLLFKALRKIEFEHASIWKKVLKLNEMPEKAESCNSENRKNLEESHSRETKTIIFYKQAEKESKNPRIRQIFNALVEVETDHLHLSEQRL